MLEITGRKQQIINTPNENTDIIRHGKKNGNLPNWFIMCKLCSVKIVKIELKTKNESIQRKQ